MNNYVRIQPATEKHPDGVVELWVKDKHAVLSAAEAAEVANALMAFETPPPPVEDPKPEPEPAAPEEPADAPSA